MNDPNEALKYTQNLLMKSELQNKLLRINNN